jgi:hypothetical protein
MSKYPNKVAQMTQDCDNLATHYWRLEASDREREYNLWLNQVKKTVDFISVYEKKFKKTA